MSACRIHSKLCMDLYWWHFFSLYAIKLKLTTPLEKLAELFCTQTTENVPEFCGKELQSVAESKDHLTNTTQTVFQKVSIVQCLQVHHKPSLVFKLTRKIANKRLVHVNTSGVCMLKVSTELNSLHSFQLFRIIHICMIQ